MRIRIITVAVLLSGCAHLRTTGETNGDLFAGDVDSLRYAAHIPGLAVVVLRDTTVLLARGFGYANIEKRIPVTPLT
ncbi:MAG: serine hydrolase, partial [Gemmatimonadaceae bacterium]|nr:serine hydrolase [Gemmatimonadaceae bacterium]